MSKINNLISIYLKGIKKFETLIFSFKKAVFKLQSLVE